MQARPRGGKGKSGIDGSKVLYIALGTVLVLFGIGLIYSATVTSKPLDGPATIGSETGVKQNHGTPQRSDFYCPVVIESPGNDATAYDSMRNLAWEPATGKVQGEDGVTVLSHANSVDDLRALRKLLQNMSTSKLVRSAVVAWSSVETPPKVSAGSVQIKLIPVRSATISNKFLLG